MVEIKTGSELDRAVAEAVGFAWGTGPLDPVYDLGEVARVEGRLFQPSTDLNAAFAAAETVGLFDYDDDTPEVHLAKTKDGEWRISAWVPKGLSG